MIRAAINRPVTVSMFVVAVMLFGWVSLDRLALNLLPDISYPSLTIQTDYEDAAPEEVESLITRPIEEAVGVVPGLTRLSSVSRSGQSEVVLEFAWKTNMDLASLDVREKLDFVNLPRDVDRPVILRFDPSYDPIMRLQLYGDLSLSRLRYVAEKDLKKSLESTDGVAAIKLIGGLEEQIRIEIDEKRLSELGIPITEVTQILAQENLNQASGSLYDLDSNYLVRMLNQFRSIDEIKQIIIRDQAGRKVVLGDVAKVWRGTKDREVIARLNGKESVSMAIYKEGDANTVTVAREVQNKLESLKRLDQFPKGVEYQTVFNQAEFIKLAVDDVMSSAVVGGLLAILVLFLFLRELRSTLTIGVSIPICIMATFALMYQTNVTLNIMSLGGVALGVGMLVDNSIVVLESIHRYKQTGKKLREAVLLGTKEVGMAVSASTLTTVVVFIPLIFVEGITGQLFKDQALTITYSVMVSMLVALTLTPMVLALQVKAPARYEPQVEPLGSELSSNRAARLLQKGTNLLASCLRPLLRFLSSDMPALLLADLRATFRWLGRLLLKPVSPALDGFDAAFSAFSRRYASSLAWSLSHKGVVIAFALVLGGIATVMSLGLGSELIPPLAQGEFSFEIKLPEGKPLEQTDRVLREIENRVASYPEVKTVFSSVGGSVQNQFARNIQEENFGQLYVVMKDKGNQKSEGEIVDRIRRELAAYPEITHKLSTPTLFSFKTPIEVEIYGYDLAILRQVADRVAGRLEAIRGLSDIKTTTQLGNPEIHVVFDRERLARLGLEESQISNILRNKIRGEVASRYREEDKQIDILVRVAESDRNTIESISNMIVNARLSTTILPREGLEDRSLFPDRGGRRFDNRRSERLLESTPTPSRFRPQDDERSFQRTERERSIVPIRLGAVADIQLARGPSEVRRIRSQRAAIVSANFSGRDLGSVSEEIHAELKRLQSENPGDVSIALAGQNEELATAYNSLLFVLALASFLVYLVMASQFESLIHPFIIMFTVPLGLIGVVFTLFITRTAFSVMVFLGVVILAGVVVDNAIVLIDYVNQLRQRGLSKREALIQGGQIRLRPIMMTTLTTSLGLVPMALGWGEGAEIRTPMAITVMGGLMFCTLLTLIVIPVAYELVDRKSYATDQVTIATPTAAAAIEEGLAGQQGFKPSL